MIIRQNVTPKASEAETKQDGPKTTQDDPKTAMVLELHVWGPAFGLSSIDPECIAAIAYCAYVLPRHDWVLIPSNDTSVSPDRM